MASAADRRYLCALVRHGPFSVARRFDAFEDVSRQGLCRWRPSGATVTPAPPDRWQRNRGGLRRTPRGSGRNGVVRRSGPIPQAAPARRRPGSSRERSRSGRGGPPAGGSTAKPGAFRFVPGYAPSTRAMFDEPDRPSRSAQRQSASQPARSRGNAARRPEHCLEVIRHRSNRPGATRAIGHTIAIDRPGRNFLRHKFLFQVRSFASL